MYKLNDIDKSIYYFEKNIKKFNWKFDSLSDLKNIEKKILKNNNINQVGGNLIIAIEYAILDAWSKYKKIDLFKLIRKDKLTKEICIDTKLLIRPIGNVIGGGAHSGGNNTDFQEFLIICPDVSYEKSLEIIIQVHKEVKKELLKRDKSFSGSKTDEGAWASTLTNYECLIILNKVIKNLSQKYKTSIRIGLDVAASEFFKNGFYNYDKFESSPKIKHNCIKKKLHRDAHIDYILYLVEKFNIYYLEDPVEQNDSEGFEIMKNHLAHKDTLIVGDDLICTNPQLLKKYKDSINSIIVKPNQVGSLLKTIEVLKKCKEYNIKPVFSHRSGETTDSILADLAAGFNVSIIKCGETTGERIVKLNRLLEIDRIN